MLKKVHSRRHRKRSLPANQTPCEDQSHLHLRHVNQIHFMPTLWTFSACSPSFQCNVRINSIYIIFKKGLTSFSKSSAEKYLPIAVLYSPIDCIASAASLNRCSRLIRPFRLFSDPINPAYWDVEVNTAMLCQFLADAMVIAGPPISIFTRAVSEVVPSLAMTDVNG